MIVTEEQRKEAYAFYREALEMLNASGAQFMLGGAFAFYHHTGIFRDTKDLDVFCKAGEYPKILKYFAERGFRTELSDVRWLAKIFKGDYFIDIIFDTVNNICTVDDTWYRRAPEITFQDVQVKVLAAEELVFCKVYVQNRERFDGADVNHVLLKSGKDMDWQRLLDHMDPHWHLLLSQIINFQFVYPSEYRDIIPKWVFDELIKRAVEQYDLPSPVNRVCRGPIIDQTQYSVDVRDWDYHSMTMRTV